MRKSILAIVGAAALTIGSAAGAAVTVTGSVGLNNPNPALPGGVVTNGNITTINYGMNPVSSPTFTGSFSLTNTLAGLYSIVLNTSSPGVTFDSAMLSGPGGPYTLSLFPDNTSLKLFPTQIAAGDYVFSFTGHSGPSGTLTGNVTITAAVPEAGTWAMMLLGFGAIGLVIRGRRRASLAPAS
jgi:PEP-CTERM motif